MKWRMGMSVVALCGLLIACYITLHDVGYIGSMVCGTGGCETVQLSPWATLLGIKTALWGVGFYVVVFALAFMSAHERWASAPWIPNVMLALTAWGVAFSAWLTWLELFRIHAICRWCVGSAVTACVLFVLALIDFRVSSRGARTGP